MSANMESKPISYPAMKCIIKHLEANKRFRLVAQCPSLEKIEKLQPLVIKKLKLNRTKISVNGVEYSLGTENKFEAPLTLAMKQLEGRRPQMNVNWLQFPDDGLILDLPQFFEKFKVRNFARWSSDNPLINRFIDDSKSMPLQLIVLSSSLELLDQYNQHEILRTSEGLLLPVVPRELFHAIETLPNEFIAVDVEGVEVIDFLNVIDALLKQDLKAETTRIFVTQDATLVSD